MRFSTAVMSCLLCITQDYLNTFTAKSSKSNLNSLHPLCVSYYQVGLEYNPGGFL